MCTLQFFCNVGKKSLLDSVLFHSTVFLTAMQFGQLLTHLDTTQQMMNNSLKDNNTLLTQVGSLLPAGGQSGSNIDCFEHWNVFVS